MKLQKLHKFEGTISEYRDIECYSGSMIANNNYRLFTDSGLDGNEAAARGNRVHDYLAKSLLGKELPQIPLEESETASNMLAMVSDIVEVGRAGSVFWVEKPFIADITVDKYNYRYKFMPDLVTKTGEDTLLILDWKTGKQPKKVAKANHVRQASIYGIPFYLNYKNISAIEYIIVYEGIMFRDFVDVDYIQYFIGEYFEKSRHLA